MPAYLYRLPTCRDCGQPATRQLRNGANAPQGEYCERHAEPALARWQAAHDDRHAALLAEEGPPRGVRPRR